MRKLVYISSPLFGDEKRDRSLAWHACRMAMARGNTPFSSHLLYSQLLDCNDPAQRELEILVYDIVYVEGRQFATHEEALAAMSKNRATRELFLNKC